MMSFSGLTSGFNDYQGEGLKAVLMERLLFETDSPHQVVSGYDLLDPSKRINNPFYLGSVAKLVANVRGTETNNMLQNSY